MDNKAHIELSLNDLILTRNGLKLLIQCSPVDSRSDGQRLLKVLDEHIRILSIIGGKDG